MKTFILSLCLAVAFVGYIDSKQIDIDLMKDTPDEREVRITCQFVKSNLAVLLKWMKKN